MVTHQIGNLHSFRQLSGVVELHAVGQNLYYGIGGGPIVAMDNHVEHNLADGVQGVVPSLYVLHLFSRNDDSHVDVFLDELHYILHLFNKIGL